MYNQAGSALDALTADPVLTENITGQGVAVKAEIKEEKTFGHNDSPSACMSMF